LSKDLNVPTILASGRSTTFRKEHPVSLDGKADKDRTLVHGLLGRLIEIDDKGEVVVKTICFEGA
jgi:hypothetical protein